MTHTLTMMPFTRMIFVLGLFLHLVIAAATMEKNFRWSSRLSASTSTSSPRNSPGRRFLEGAHSRYRSLQEKDFSCKSVKGVFVPQPKPPVPAPPSELDQFINFPNVYAFVKRYLQDKNVQRRADDLSSTFKKLWQGDFRDHVSKVWVKALRLVLEMDGFQLLNIEIETAARFGILDFISRLEQRSSNAPDSVSLQLALKRAKELDQDLSFRVGLYNQNVNWDVASEIPWAREYIEKYESWFNEEPTVKKELDRLIDIKDIEAKKEEIADSIKNLASIADKGNLNTNAKSKSAALGLLICWSNSSLHQYLFTDFFHDTCEAPTKKLQDILDEVDKVRLFPVHHQWVKFELQELKDGLQKRREREEEIEKENLARAAEILETVPVLPDNS